MLEQRVLTAGRRTEFYLRCALRANSAASLAFYKVTAGFKVPADLIWPPIFVQFWRSSGGINTSAHCSRRKQVKG